jgi:hypothetical protein
VIKLVKRKDLKPYNFMFWEDGIYGCCEGCRLKGKKICDIKCFTSSHIERGIYVLSSNSGKKERKCIMH